MGRLLGSVRTRHFEVVLDNLSQAGCIVEGIPRKGDTMRVTELLVTNRCTCCGSTFNVTPEERLCWRCTEHAPGFGASSTATQVPRALVDGCPFLLGAPNVCTCELYGYCEVCL